MENEDGARPIRNPEQAHRRPGVEHGASQTERAGVAEVESKSASLIFINHEDKRFVFPLDSAKTWESFKLLLAQIYSRADHDIRDAVSSNNFDILNIDNEIILPTVWESVVKYHLPQEQKHGSICHTVKIAFWHLNSQSVEDETRPYVASRPAEAPKLHDTDAEREATYRPRGRVNLFRDLPERFGRARSEERSRSRKSLGIRRVPSTSDDIDIRREIRHDRRRSRSVSPTPRYIYRESDDEGNSGSGDEDEDEESSTDDSSTDLNNAPRRTQLPPQPRNVGTLSDCDGNRLIWLIDTSKVKFSKTTSTSNATSSGAETSKRSFNMKTDNLRIIKAVQSFSDARMAIQVHTLPGPENPSVSPSISIRWHHLYAETLDFGQFKQACLDFPGLCSRKKILIADLLKKIEKEKTKAGEQGLFIEPGTVLRADEKCQQDSSSVIFSCVPHYDVRDRTKNGLTNADRLFRPSSLMQAYYPYQPVEERDSEQAFRKFRGGSSPQIVYVPSTWIMNIDAHAVVTCGYNPLSEDFVKSIEIVEEVIKPSVESHDSKGSALNSITNIRLRDWEGRDLLFTPKECESYFEFEQKLREMKYPVPVTDVKDLRLACASQDSQKAVLPQEWTDILKAHKGYFLDLTMLDEQKVADRKADNIELGSRNITRIGEDLKEVQSDTLGVLPFLYWPNGPITAQETSTTGFGYDTTTGGTAARQSTFIPPHVKHAMYCLEQVEKTMMAEILGEWDAESPVEKSFTSTKYYEELPESTVEDVRQTLISLLQHRTSLGIGSNNLSLHQKIVEEHYSKLANSVATLTEILYETLKLFTSDVDKSTMLRKLWGSVQKMYSVVQRIQQRCTTPKTRTSGQSGRDAYVVRTQSSIQQGKFVPLPDDEDVKNSIRNCRTCKAHTKYSDREAAISHLHDHLKSQTNPKAKTNVDDWVIGTQEKENEETNAGHLAILDTSIKQARVLLSELQQLVGGVKNADSQLSKIYTFPHELLKSLHRTSVFYFAAERSLYFTESMNSRGTRTLSRRDKPYAKMGLKVIERFGESAKSSILLARRDLCSMARSPAPEHVSQRLSLGPLYICSWFIRRLLVQPAIDGLTVADIYRDYISTLQFEVNHSPSKRLLRSIKLVQEELTALQRVNAWQKKLIQSYDKVLNDRTYQFEILEREGMFPYERQVLDSCLDNLQDTLEDYNELYRRCDPMSESTKQWSEINEENNGKAIMVFTIVTVIFLPLSFVTSYLGMNTSDIRDMENKQSLFWEISLPLTVVTMGVMLFIAYNGEELRTLISTAYRRLLGKPDLRPAPGGIGVAQRKLALKYRPQAGSDSNLDYRSLADEAEFSPTPTVWDDLTRNQIANYEDYTKTTAATSMRWAPPPPLPPPLPPPPALEVPPYRTVAREDPDDPEWLDLRARAAPAAIYETPRHQRRYQQSGMADDWRARRARTELQDPLLPVDTTMRYQPVVFDESRVMHTTAAAQQTKGYDWVKKRKHRRHVYRREPGSSV
ncbi:hypothetical protein BU24DRAFT_426613 [Aaosphaeria arxii CBS 175.79]|uniref:Ubiquitin-like domain-containing protein n=1 Tax=Aaosphaeria arxii CBS 175.79 TaxID=1450172 RepID=A0A6A5XF31_9PLEO|nr:uncharacterized protein BU24DRAFT_426613 [Aaosphaeria arxii CBS 175.79]KAF2011530.1 hypothetical protein BU24DRAFT_426613 [Aaosphaeria arxii CBS 175.79]